jgi:hypothetical protein
MRAMPTPPSRPIVLGMLAAGALAGYGASVSLDGSTTVNAPSMQKTLDQIQRQARSRPAVSCPFGEQAADGRQFTCTATLPDGTAATPGAAIRSKLGLAP